MGSTGPGRPTLWAAHRHAHRRNFERRFSETAEDVDPDTRLPPPRYWLLHTLAHVLIREMAMSAATARPASANGSTRGRRADGRPPAAGLLICTTASDSDGTLGGLVAAQRAGPARNGSSSPRCAGRPGARRTRSAPCARRSDPEDFLHGAACHCCAMASETSCERANRFLDRRFLIDLPGSDRLASSDSPLRPPPGGSAALLTGTEAREIADRLADGDTLTAALRVVAPGRRPEVRSLPRAPACRDDRCVASSPCCGRSRVRGRRPRRSIRCGPCRATWPRAGG